MFGKYSWITARRIAIALLLFVSVVGERSNAGEFYIGGGPFSRSFNGDGEVAWFAVMEPDSSITLLFESFDLTEIINFTPELDVPGAGYNGLGWPGKSTKSGKLFFGFRFSRHVALQASLQLATSKGTLDVEEGWTGAATFTEKVLTNFRHSAQTLELKLFPFGKWIYLLGGLERSHVSVEIGGIQTTNFNNSIGIYDYPLGEGMTDIAPIIGGGGEIFFGRNFGFFAQATYSYSEFNNFVDDKPTLDFRPNLQFDTGGLGLLAGVIVKLRSAWR